MSGAERQELYAKARGRDMAEVAYALKERLDSKTGRTTFTNTYRGTPSGRRLRRGLARLLYDDPATLAFFDALILSDLGSRSLGILGGPRRYEVIDMI